MCGELIDAAGALFADCWGRALVHGATVLCLLRLSVRIRGKWWRALRCLYEVPAALYTSARSALLYNDASRPLVLVFKHEDRTRYANAFGHWLARAGAKSLPQAGMLVPVPLHPWRLLHRRYNQSLLLARVVCPQAG